jgi:hypothetical protein
LQFSESGGDGRVAENTNQAKPFDGRVVLCTAIIALAVAVSIAVRQADTALFLNLFALGPALIVLSLFLVAYLIFGKGRKRRSTILSALGAVWLIFFLCFAYQPRLRTTARWLAWSGHYKSAVFAQDTAPQGELKHVEWDAWGWGGMDTTVYLVFDPTDSLSSAASTHQPGKFAGIPCKVPKVSRLENQWYAVTFYTNQVWGHCNETTQ